MKRRMIWHEQIKDHKMAGDVPKCLGQHNKIGISQTDRYGEDNTLGIQEANIIIHLSPARYLAVSFRA